MKFSKLIIPVRRAAFLVLTILLLIQTGLILDRKTTGGPWNYDIKLNGFFNNEPKNSYDILCFGSSHAYCTFSPNHLYEKSGLRSYVLATQRQPPIATYYYIEEALKTQHPEIVLVEAYMFASEAGPVAEGIAHDAIDPFPSSLTKLKLIANMDTEDSAINYIFPFLKYHSRWKELTASDYDFSYKNKTDPYHGFVFLTDTVANTLTSIPLDQVEAVPLPEEHLQILLDIKQLTEEHNTKLVLLVSPFKTDAESYGMFKMLHQFADTHNIDIFDMNVEFDEEYFNPNTDFYDKNHFNVYGAEKATDLIYEFLQDRYVFTPEIVDDLDDWSSDLSIYTENK